MDIAWAVFSKATLQFAVRSGVRYGITITGAQAGAVNSDQTAMVKNAVQQNALWLLRGDAGRSRIKVRYFQPPAPGSTGPVVDVSTQANGNAPLHIMQVSVEGYSLPALIPRIYRWNQPADNRATVINAVAADLIEPSRDVPPIGVAP
jgi:hypothetical protein